MTPGALRVKAPVLLLLALIIACLGIAFMPASAHAEGFFSKTVKCVFSIPLLSNCRQTTPEPAPAAPTKTPEATPTKEPASNNSTKSNTKSTTPSQTESNSGQTGVSGELLTMPDTDLHPHAPLVGMASAGNANSRGSAGYIASTASLGATTTVYPSSSTDDGAFLARTETGWHIAGTPWFLWAIGILGLAGVITSVKRLNLSKNSTLPKA